MPALPRDLAERLGLVPMADRPRCRTCAAPLMIDGQGQSFGCSARCAEQAEQSALEAVVGRDARDGWHRTTDLETPWVRTSDQA
jgi:hypothetical protein